MLLLLALILQSSCQSLHHEAHPVFSSSSWDTQHFLFFLILITIFKNTSLVGSYLYNLQVEMDISISPNRSHSVKYTAIEVIIWRQTIQWHLQCGVTTPFTYFQNKFWLKSKTLYLISQKKKHTSKKPCPSAAFTSSVLISNHFAFCLWIHPPQTGHTNTLRLVDSCV